MINLAMYQFLSGLQLDKLMTYIDNLQYPGKIFLEKILRHQYRHAWMIKLSFLKYLIIIAPACQ